MSENIHHFCGWRARITGVGNLISTFYSLDKTKSAAMKDLELDTLTDKEPMKLGNFTSQRTILRLEVTELGESFDVNRLIIFGKPVGTGHKG